MDWHISAGELKKIEACCSEYLYWYASRTGNEDEDGDAPFPENAADWLVQLANAINHTQVDFSTNPLVASQIYTFAALYVVTYLHEDSDTEPAIFVQEIRRLYKAGEVSSPTRPQFFFWVCWFIIRPIAFRTADNPSVVQQEAIDHNTLWFLYGIVVDTLVEATISDNMANEVYTIGKYEGPPLAFTPDRSALETIATNMDMKTSFHVEYQELICRLLPLNTRAFIAERESGMSFLNTVDDDESILGAVVRSATEEYELHAGVRHIAAVVAFFVTCTFVIFKRVIKVQLNRAILDKDEQFPRTDPVILLHRRGLMGVLLPTNEVILIDDPMHLVLLCLHHLIQTEKMPDVKHRFIQYNRLIKGNATGSVHHTLQSLQSEIEAWVTAHPTADG